MMLIVQKKKRKKPQNNISLYTLRSLVDKNWRIPLSMCFTKKMRISKSLFTIHGDDTTTAYAQVHGLWSDLILKAIVGALMKNDEIIQSSRGEEPKIDPTQTIIELSGCGDIQSNAN